MAKAGKGNSMGSGATQGHQHVGPQDPDTAFDQDDLADQIRGKNKLQGNDQESVKNQRETWPDAQTETDDVVESFRKIDPERRTGKRPGS